MAIVERWFSTAAAGAGDGTSWANRAEFISSGSLSSIIFGHDYSVDTLIAYVGPGTYANTGNINSAAFTVSAPVANGVGHLFLVGCDSSGVELEPNNPDWECSEGDLDTTGYPVITSTQRIDSTCPSIGGKCLKIVFDYPQVAILSNAGIWQSCWLENISANTATGVFSSITRFVIANSQLVVSSTSYNYICSTLSGAAAITNTRFVGNASATTGNLNGLIVNASNTAALNQGPVCVLNTPGVGMVNTSGSTSAGMLITRATINNCGTGIETRSGVGGGAGALWVANSYIANCTTGIRTSTSNPKFLIENVRLRNTTNYSDTSYFPVNDHTAAGSDAEYVNAAAGDYRMSRDSVYWGRNIGAHDQEALGSGGGSSADMRGGFVN